MKSSTDRTSLGPGVTGWPQVVWAEGTFLGQQHFQQWQHSWEASQNYRTCRTRPLGWGLLDLEVDDKSLANGSFQLLACTVIFPDGRLIAYRASEGHSLACELGGRGGDVLEVFLGFPANEDVSGISGYPQKGRHCAWEAEYRTVPDLYDPQREREVLLARPNLVLLTGEERRGEYRTLKLAEVRNEGDGTFLMLPDYIPPVARIGASPRLQRILGRILEMVVAKQRSLRQHCLDAAGGAGEYAQRDPGNFQLLQQLSAAYPQLRHFQQHPDLSPESLYRCLIGVAGALAAFGSQVEVKDLPLYRHDDLAAVFAPLEAMFGALAEVTIAARISNLSLERETPMLLVAAGLSSAFLRANTLFLEVLVEDDDPNWVVDFSRQVKVSARSTLEMIVASALPGVRLVHTQRPPGKLAVKSGHEYFRLEAKGELWERVVQEETLAVFLTQHFVGACVELVSVQE